MLGIKMVKSLAIIPPYRVQENAVKNAATDVGKGIDRVDCSVRTTPSVASGEAYTRIADIIARNPTR